MKYILSLSCVALLLIAIAVGMHWPGKQEANRYLTSAARRADIEDVVLAAGSLAPRLQVVIGAQVNGQIKSITVKTGDAVVAGQLLAEIDPSLQLNALRKATDNLRAARAQKISKEAVLRRALITVRRQASMLDFAAISKADLEDAEINVELAKADLSALEAQISQAQTEVEIARTQLGFTRILSPIDGVVMSVPAKVGQTIVSAQASPTLLVVGDTSTITVNAQISEVDIVRVKVGQTAHFNVLGEPNRTFTGELQAVELVPDTGAHALNASASPLGNTAVYYRAIFDVRNEDNRLKPAMSAQVRIVQESARQSILVPVAAFPENPRTHKLQRIKVLAPNGTTEIRDVRIGIVSGAQAQAIAGVEEGEAVIVGDVDADAAFQAINS